ncbi:MAG: InlB B-repeat-containing protein [Clostridia bacterium]|nr:InlB B-repeat-containing protein [Clostridia bacterium]
MKKHILLTILVLSTLILLFSCGAKEYIVTFDANGGSKVDTQIVKDGQVVIKPDTPTKEGYTFKGWYKDNIEWSFVGDTVKDNVILKAKWEKNKYTVTFDANGGSGGKTETVEHGGTVSAPLPSRANYSFEGWYVNDTKWNFKTDVITSDITLTAKWEPFTKTVTFDAGEGTVSEKTRKVKYGEEIGILPTPELQNHNFLGWYDSDDVKYENRITKTYTVTSNVRLVALWEITETLDPVEHSWSTWIQQSTASCTEPEKLYRTCSDCGETEYKDGQPSLGHDWLDWDTKTEATCTDNEVLYRKCSVCKSTEEKDGLSASGHNLTAFNYGMLSHSAYCDRCKTTITYNYENLASSIKKTTISGNVIGAENVSCLYNGNWDETSGTFCAKGGSITVDIEFEQPTDADIIYVKGKGYYSYYVYALYEGDSEYTMIGTGAFGSEACRFNLYRKITKISIQMENGGYLDGYWQEVAIVKIPENV